MDWRQACADTHYVERDTALGIRGGRRCCRLKSGRMQSGVWVVVVLCIRVKWTAERCGVELNCGRRERLAVWRDERCWEQKSACRGQDDAVSFGRSAECSSHSGCLRTVNCRVIYSGKMVLLL